MRTPREQWYDLTSHAGSLTIEAPPQSIGGKAQPSFIGRRQQHGWASASTAMRYMPLRPGDEAGLVAFQNDKHYYFLGVALENGQTAVHLKRRAGPAEAIGGTVVASAPIHLTPAAPVYLKIEARGGQYDFYYGTSPGQWTALVRDADGTFLSTKLAGGFVGTTIGMYATTNEK